MGKDFNFNEPEVILYSRYKELEDRFRNYKLSKQASYEAMQTEVNALTRDCEELKATINSLRKCCRQKDETIKNLKNAKSNKLYGDLLDVIEPYLSDFTGYDKDKQAFNIVLAVKELLEEANNEHKVVIPSFSISIPPEVNTATVGVVIEIVKKAVENEIRNVMGRLGLK